ncbi:MAG: glycoside hydrolase family 2 TIM barrel-domain containing protein [Fimbriimonas sp.]|nr:glycoside hydrolase family 2 TIM barrel-domain containing protein [Fimbriimonas sp.]
MELWDRGWRFGEADDASLERFDDSNWSPVDLPHDWSLDDLPTNLNCPRRSGPFDPDSSPGKGATGFVLGGTRWYRKQFFLTDVERAEVRFEGAYCETDVWLNGVHLGSHVHGYTPFCFDLTPHLHPKRENVLAVRVRNEGWNSRWYTGSGIFRHVWLKMTGEVFIPMDGVFVSTCDVTDEHAKIAVSVEVENGSQEEAIGDVYLRVRDPWGLTVLNVSRPFQLDPGGESVIAFDDSLDRPQLWSLENPNLYTASIRVRCGEQQMDVESVTFGVRDIRLSSVMGLQLNGKSVKIKGGCVHHDNGLLGAAAIDRAEARRVELLKAAGYNGIRTSHNAPSPAFLDACDRLGMLVMDEAFDEWAHPKTEDGYAKRFEHTSRAVLTLHVRRDRNHPSVVMWSIGNEIPECFDKPEIALRLRNMVLQSDPTRPISQGVCHSFWPGFEFTDWESSSDPGFLHLDIAGYNYQHANYEPDHSRHPDRIVLGTESFPKDIFEIWDLVETHPWVIGDYTWTALDYYGESGIGYVKYDGSEPVNEAYPRHLAECGDLDIVGERKPPSYYRQALWEPGVLYAAVGQEPDALTVLDRLQTTDWRPKWGWPNVLPHWTYPDEEGTIKDVVVYSSFDSVKLTLNGRVLGEKLCGKEQRRQAVFQVPYEPGELIVTGESGEATGRFELRTAGAPSAIRVVTDRPMLTEGEHDLSYVKIEIVDKQGIVVPHADNKVEVTVDGPGRLAALGTADPTDVASVRSHIHRAWRGGLTAIVQPTGENGVIRVEVASEGLAPTTIELRVARR